MRKRGKVRKMFQPSLGKLNNSTMQVIITAKNNLPYPSSFGSWVKHSRKKKMKLKNPIIALLFTTAAISSNTSAFAATTKLKEAEITTAISGKTFAYSGRNSGVLTYTSNSFKGKDKKHGKFSGTWWVKGDKYCFKNSFGNSRCSSVKPKGDGVLKFDRHIFKPQ